MKAKTIKSIGLACAALMFASCASDPYYSNNGYGGGGGYPNNGGGQIDPTRTAALVAAGIAGLSLYHYSKEKDKRKKSERAHSVHHPNQYGYGNNYSRRGYDQRGSGYRGY